MAKVMLLTLVCVVLVLFSAAHEKEEEEERYCGIALSTGHDPHHYYQSNVRYVMKDMTDRHANYIQISAYASQIGVDSLKINWKTDEHALAHVFRVAKQSGLKIFFKPVFDLISEEGNYIWRGRLTGTKKWFDNVFNPYILSMARLAEREGVDVMAVGSEYRASVNKTGRWINSINQIRKVYSGKLTYIGNHDAYHYVKFWRHLDFISISTYYRLVWNKNATMPSYNETVGKLSYRAKKITRWRQASNLTHMKVLVAEFGYQSKGGLVNYYLPWDWEAPGKIDKRMQKWALGAFVWHYEIDRHAGKTWRIDGYTPQDKPAQWVMKRYFKKFCG